MKGLNANRWLTIGVALCALTWAAAAPGAIVIDSGKMIFDYTVEINPGTIAGLLATSYNAAGPNHFTDGLFQTSMADATHGLGWSDDSAKSQISVGYTVYGDADLNGTVALADLGKVLTNWGTGTKWAEGDVDYSGHVGLGDLGKVLTNWGGSVGALIPTTTVPNVTVPEPATLIVWSLLGGVSWFGLRVYRQVRGRRRPWSEENRAAILKIIERN